ncbi:hypothetical protein G3I30_18635 [Actinospica acidiphila]|uniref:ABC-type Mn/Zn transport systems, ATPase component n=1 Tax=Streptomyces tunisiensis TaxID=948699 RepID=A0ABP7Z5K8_9ACTN|nr:MULTISPECIES: hypothetical protein [unclassified Streptomyces]AXI84752.1 hypothetical protein SAM9427_01270 [Streptomyces sp. ETH9427]NEA81053.1 hypothetical protein [Actinospica acidiphila]WPW17280.1 hypothetical protein UBV09_00520 [Streptomyces griseoincarnatus]MBQ0974613.1 hypothetical protein [Streptomyces sp. RK31]MBU5947251.1 hypothetical protein [Streptomyces sp. PAM3C]
MSERNTVIRSLHDVGLAAWFGGSLMGAVGLNGAAQDEGSTETSRDRIASSGWARWTPVNAAAIGAHLFGGGGLLAVNAHRVATQQGVGASTAAKTVVTAAALAATAYARVLGKKVELASSTDPGDVEKAGKHPIDLDKVRHQLSAVQWAVPALTGCLVVLNALHGEQQRPTEQIPGMWERARSMTHLMQ